MSFKPTVLAMVLLLTAPACGEDERPAAAQDSHAAAADVAAGDAAAGDAGNGDAGNGATTDAAAAVPTWHATVNPIVMNRCGGCHGSGGIAPFRLDRPDDWKMMGAPALTAMEAGRMPPWPADPTCGKFGHRGDMPAAEIATVAAWLTGGRPEGDLKDAPQVATPMVITPTHKLPMKESYTPPKGDLDTYRCFFLDLDTSQKDWFLKASQVVPGSRKLVHHVLIYGLEGEHIQAAEAAEKKEAGPGYSCFGGPLPSTAGGSLLEFATGFPNQIAAWVPGLQPRVLPDAYAIRIKKGSRVVMQVHYNVAAGETEADTTRLDLVLTEKPPERMIVTRPLVIRDLNIPAGAAAAAHEATYRYYGKGEVRIHSLTPHMHLLGSSFQSEIKRHDGATQCAVRVPNWDFSWQQAYARPQDDPIVLKHGDGLSLRCTYDNTQANQPRVNGKQITPKKVAWGDGSLDEMCLLYLDMSVPYAPGLPAGAAACTGVDTCQKTCDASSPLDCVYGCTETEAVCGTCVIGKVVSCAGLACAGPLLAAQTCLTNCLISSLMLDTNASLCLDATCADKWSNVKACVNPKLAKGECDKQLKPCGVAFGTK